MPKTKKTTKTESRVSTKVSKPQKSESLMDKMQDDLQNNQSYLNIILGGLIIIILGVLVFNWFNKSTGNIGPSQQAKQTEGQDISKDNLPGTYTIKTGDTLFSIAQNYYSDGYKYTEIVKENKLANENSIEVGQKITIPKVDSQQAMASESPMASASPETSMSPAPTASPAMDNNQMNNQTMWGEKIDGKTYTVKMGDTLANIAGRAYGDALAYEKIAKANNLSNSNAIEIGMVLKLPR